MSSSDPYTPDRLAALPSHDGFRLRGTEMTRLETFADAAFAFAVTLLVVGGGDSVPQDFAEMTAALRQVPAFAASFANIMLFWYAHHVWSRRFGLEDGVSVLLTLLLVFVVLIYVYPLKAIYSGAMEFFTGGYLESYFGLATAADLRSLFVIFGTGYGSLSLVIVLLNRHALAVGDRLRLDHLERYDTQTQTTHWAINAGVALTSVVLALVLPDRYIVVAGLFYGTLSIVLPWHGVRSGRRRGDIRAAGTAGPEAPG